MQKVGILAETVSIELNLLQVFALHRELPLPVLVAVVGARVLEAPQDVFVVVCYARDLLDTHRSIQRSVRVQSVRVRIRHLGCRRLHVFRFIEINLEHLAQQNPVLVLNLTHAL